MSLNSRGFQGLLDKIYIFGQRVRCHRPAVLQHITKRGAAGSPSQAVSQYSLLQATTGTGWQRLRWVANLSAISPPPWAKFNLHWDRKISNSCASLCSVVLQPLPAQNGQTALFILQTICEALCCLCRHLALHRKTLRCQHLQLGW